VRLALAEVADFKALNHIFNALQPQYDRERADPRSVNSSTALSARASRRPAGEHDGAFIARQPYREPGELIGPVFRHATLNVSKESACLQRQG
jgi:hypothetical protein